MSATAVVLGTIILLAVVQMVLQKYAPVYAVLLSMAAAVFLLLRLSGAAGTVLSGIAALGRQGNGQAFSCLLRCAGILILTDYARTLCEETGAASLGWCAGFSGRCLALAAAFPLLEEVCRRIGGLAS